MTDIFEINDAKFLAQDDMIIRWLRGGNGPFEPVTTPWIFEKLEENEGLYVDVGASTGWFAVPIAIKGREVVAIECNPRVLERLRANADLNKVSLEIHPVAASDKIGEAEFGSNPTLPLTSGGSLESGIRANQKKETVKTATLDSIVQDRKVAVLKIDVEGHEVTVLRGAKEFIMRDRPYMILEANSPAHVTALEGVLEELGYTYVMADVRNLLCSPK